MNFHFPGSRLPHRVLRGKRFILSLGHPRIPRNYAEIKNNKYRKASRIEYIPLKMNWQIKSNVNQTIHTQLDITSVK